MIWRWRCEVEAGESAAADRRKLREGREEALAGGGSWD
jgi:hypothetical protein